MYEHNAFGYRSGLALCLTKVRSSRARCPATALIGIEVKPTDCTFQFNKYVLGKKPCILRGRINNASVAFFEVREYRFGPFFIYEGKAKSSWTFLITFIIDVRLFSYFHKCNNGLLSTFM